MPDLFANVKVGDVFFTSHSFYEMRKHMVERVTASRFYGKEGGEYRKLDGYLIGQSGFKNIYAMPATQEVVAEWNAKMAEANARIILIRAANKMRTAKGGEAIRLAALLPPELKGTKNG